MGWTRRDIAATFQRMLRERYEEVGREVKRLRLSKGLTHEGLAHEAKVSVKTISRVENGRLHEHRGGTYRKLAVALGVPPEVLLAPLFSSQSAGAHAPTAEEIDRRLRGADPDSSDQDDLEEGQGGA